MTLEPGSPEASTRMRDALEMLQRMFNSNGKTDIGIILMTYSHVDVENNTAAANIIANGAPPQPVGHG